jgi:hypothetical protein
MLVITNLIVVAEVSGNIYWDWALLSYFQSIDVE